MLAHYNITREQLIDLAILIGTDFNEGIKGIGPKKALKLVSEFGSIENMPAEIQETLTALAPAIRDIFRIQMWLMIIGSNSAAPIRKESCDSSAMSGNSRPSGLSMR